jgi:hypothetical protein
MRLYERSLVKLIRRELSLSSWVWLLMPRAVVEAN